MIAATARVEYSESYEVIKLKPLFDLHIGAVDHDREALKQTLKDADDRTLFFGGGDILSCIIPSDAKRYRKSGDPYEGEAILDDQIDEAYELLKPYSERILGMLRGNHEDEILKRCSTDPMGRLCKALDVPYLGYSSMFRLVLHRNNGRSRTVRFRLHHGWGRGGVTEGAGLNKYTRDVSYWDADVYLYGHTHELVHKFLPRKAQCGNRVISRPRLVAICGSYQRLVNETTDTTYAERSGLKPNHIGGLTITISITNDWVKLGVIT